MDERFDFLDQAVRAGSRDAVFDFYAEGPQGRAWQGYDANDPLVAEWKGKAASYLLALAETGDRQAWGALQNDYENGITVARDYQTSIMYAAALWPTADVTRISYVAVMAKQLPPQQVQQALEQGRALANSSPTVAVRAEGKNMTTLLLSIATLVALLFAPSAGTMGTKPPENYGRYYCESCPISMDPNQTSLLE